VSKLVFSLNSAREWKQEHDGFHYPSFYNFIVDFFEDVDDETTNASVNELFEWWNWYVFFCLFRNRCPNVSLLFQ